MLLDMRTPLICSNKPISTELTQIGTIAGMNPPYVTPQSRLCQIATGTHSTGKGGKRVVVGCRVLREFFLAPITEAADDLSLIHI